jgi:hypothetical protein
VDCRGSIDGILRLAAESMRKLLLPVALALISGRASADEESRQKALATMRSATHFFRTEIATRGGYLWKYSDDLKMREGEVAALPTVIWVQPPGTPSVGIAYLDAWAATGDSLYLQAAVDAARALAWGQLASGGWYYRIEFTDQDSRRWYYRRNVDAGDTEQAGRRNKSVFDDDTSQSALRLLMRVDSVLQQQDTEIHHAVEYALSNFLRAQYANGAWPQHYDTPSDSTDLAILPARYPASWSRVFPGTGYGDYYTFNDNALADVIDVMLEAHRTYGDIRYLEAALRGGDFMIRAQMPEPQPAWAQQYNHRMEPAWAREFEPPSITGGESYGVMRALLDLYIETGEHRFLSPLRPALSWARRSLLPDGRLARFYELKTNRPLYFVRDTYELTYSDADVPTHYAFKVRGIERIESLERKLRNIEQEGAREAILARRRLRFRGSLKPEDDDRVREIAASMDERGRFVEDGSMRPSTYGQPLIRARVIQSETFVRNLEELARYVALTSALE